MRNDFDRGTHVIQPHLLWGYLHLLLFVFWLGTDIGSLMSLAMVRNAKRSFETRMALTRLSLALDKIGRAHV